MNTQKHQNCRTTKLLVQSICAGALGGTAIAQTDITVMPDINYSEHDLVPWELINSEEDKSPLFHFWGINGNVDATASLSYDSNTRGTGGDGDGDFELSIVPGIVFSKSDERKSLSLSYSPFFRIFLTDSSLSAIDHRLNFSASVNVNRFAFRVGQTFRKATDIIAESGTRGNDLSYATSVGVSYFISDKSSLDVNGLLDIRDSEDLTGYTNWQNSNWYNYVFSPKLTAGVGVTFGWQDVDNGVDQTYQNIAVRGTYATTEKIAINGSFGGQWRQYDSDRGGTFTPTFSLGIGYKLREGTSLDLSSYYGTTPSRTSAFQNYNSFGIRAGISQRIVERLSARLRFGYERRDYIATTDQLTNTQGEEDYYSAVIGFNYLINSQWSAALTYDYTKNVSSTAPYDRNRVTLSATWRY